MVKITGGQRIDLLGIQKEEAAGGLAGPRHAVWPRLCKGFSHLQNLRRHRLLSLRCRRQHALGIEIEQRFQGFESPTK